MRGGGNSTVSRKIVDPLFYILAATSILCALLIKFRESHGAFLDFSFLLWNLYLAWLPLLCSMVALIWARVAKGASLAIGLIALGIGWLLLFPNAPYLMTDLIHLIFTSDYLGYDVDGLLLWFDLVLYFIFTWCGMLLGYLSMNQIHAIVRHYWDSAMGWAFVFGSSMLSGFGVYLGRIVRLNSWDVLHPGRIVEQIIDAIHFNSIAFSILFGTLILIVYVSLYAITTHARVSSSAERSTPSSL
ncbi:DUF1361 domain-containing protein [Cohnella yongneupensis]|uniref:DUF1361 domain-containing protein n=1 Tax=Cohnella yongneupensis TaxID=425006 RepID=A0ABW0R2B6_9BACL